VNRVTLDVELRSEKGKGPARRMRADGKIPAIFYGKKSEPIPLAVDAVSLRKSVDAGGQNVVFELNITDAEKGGKKSALLKESQVRPLDGEVLHLDFIEVFEDVEVDVTVPLVFNGKPEGLDKGGVVEYAARSVSARCLPKNIPESIEVDISPLDINQSLHVKDLTIPEGITILDNEELGVVSVILPKRAALAEAEEEVGEEAAEGEAAEAAEGEAKTEEEGEGS
jgi:large subunit ribosomal protein L25